jgi:hypothetical protein
MSLEILLFTVPSSFNNFLQVKTAAEKALAELKAANPENDLTKLKIDIPAAGPSNQPPTGMAYGAPAYRAGAPAYIAPPNDFPYYPRRGAPPLPVQVNVGLGGIGGAVNMPPAIRNVDFAAMNRAQEWRRDLLDGMRDREHLAGARAEALHDEALQRLQMANNRAQQQLAIMRAAGRDAGAGLPHHGGPHLNPYAPMYDHMDHQALRAREQLLQAGPFGVQQPDIGLRVEVNVPPREYGMWGAQGRAGAWQAPLADQPPPPAPAPRAVVPAPRRNPRRRR